ncbi:MAG: SDR family oxidoreductase [Deltaproteobacteria bacterium]|nr:SDR family oxidoreductase [Deltaproteobacteria bacterium]
MAAKVVLVTGATDGIGRQTALQLARAGARVIVHGRNAERVEAARQLVRRETPEAPEPEGLVADLASLDAVRRLADEVRGRHERLDVLVNNAGVYETARALTIDGFERTFAVNHLAHFLLANLLLDRLRAAAPSRVVTVSSVAHHSAELDLDDPQAERSWDSYAAYASSKLANVLFANALARRVAPDGVSSNSLHPGVIGTKLLRVGFGRGGASVEKGAETSVHLALSPDAADFTGRYFVDKRPARPSAAALDVPLQERLWELSERLVGGM